MSCCPCDAARMNERLSAGAYESLHTRALDRTLGAVLHAIPQFGEVEPAEAPEVLARHVADAVRRRRGGRPWQQGASLDGTTVTGSVMTPFS
jgi:hypothetical protein